MSQQEDQHYIVIKSNIQNFETRQKVRKLWFKKCKRRSPLLLGLGNTKLFRGWFQGDAPTSPGWRGPRKMANGINSGLQNKSTQSRCFSLVFQRFCLISGLFGDDSSEYHTQIYTVSSNPAKIARIYTVFQMHCADTVRFYVCEILPFFRFLLQNLSFFQFLLCETKPIAWNWFYILNVFFVRLPANKRIKRSFVSSNTIGSRVQIRSIFKKKLFLRGVGVTSFSNLNPGCGHTCKNAENFVKSEEPIGKEFYLPSYRAFSAPPPTKSVGFRPLRWFIVHSVAQYKPADIYYSSAPVITSIIESYAQINISETIDIPTKVRRWKQLGWVKSECSFLTWNFSDDRLQSQVYGQLRDANG